MSLSLILVILVGVVAAGPVEWPTYALSQPTGHRTSINPSSIPCPDSSTKLGYVTSTGLYSSLQPRSSNSPSPSLSTGWSTNHHVDMSSVITRPTRSSGFVSYATSIQSHGTGHVFIPWGTGLSSGSAPLSTGVSSSLRTNSTSYTTTSLYSVTRTSGSAIITTLATSTYTVTKECHGHCHKPSKPAHSEHGITTTVPVTTTTYAWIPCSTSVGDNGKSAVYSTYLTPSWYPVTYLTTTVIYPTASSLPMGIATPSTTAASQCPGQVTATVTVTMTPIECRHCQTKTFIVTESGSTMTLTMTVTPTSMTQPTSKSDQRSSDSSKISTASGLSPAGASSVASNPSGSGYVPYPTGGSWHSGMVSGTGRSGPKPTIHVW